jgi:hypothetical protein
MRIRLVIKYRILFYIPIILLLAYFNCKKSQPKIIIKFMPDQAEDYYIIR